MDSLTHSCLNMVPMQQTGHLHISTKLKHAIAILPPQEYYSLCTFIGFGPLFICLFIFFFSEVTVQSRRKKLQFINCYLLKQSHDYNAMIMNDQLHVYFLWLFHFKIFGFHMCYQNKIFWQHIILWIISISDTTS